jgi:putative LysE/RhtB family amino acid efflux pump
MRVPGIAKLVREPRATMGYVFAPALAGLGLGLAVAAQVGPLWLLCARSSARYGARVGLSIGAAVALVDTIYAALGALGAARLVTIDVLRVALGFLGAGVLIWLGAKTLWSAWRIRLGSEAVEEISSPGRAFRTAFIATASNPLTIASWAAVFAAASVADVTGDPWSATLLVIGVGVGSFAWHVALAVGMAAVGKRAGSRILAAVDDASGAALVGFGGILAWRTIRSD